MKHLLLLLSCCYALCGSAQTDAQGVYYLVVRKPSAPRRVSRQPAPSVPVPAVAVPQQPEAVPAEVQQQPRVVAPQSPPAEIPDLPPPTAAGTCHDVRDVFRGRQTERIALQQPENKAIAQLGSILLAEVLAGRLTGFCPDDFAKGYGPLHARRDLAKFAQAVGESGDLSQWCGQLLDVAGETAFDPTRSQMQFRPRYLHLLWRHPDLARGECLLTVIPWEVARPLLAGFAALPPLEQFSLAEAIETHQYQAVVVRASGAWLHVLPNAALHGE